MSDDDSHDWHWMAEAYNDGERWDYYECEACGETKVEKTELDFPIETPENSNPVAWGSMK